MKNSQKSGLLFITALVLCSSWIVDSMQNRFYKRSRLCRQYPEDILPYRFHRETGKCYQVGQRGPCPNLMRFTLENDDYGFCDCDLSERCGRPLVYWPARDRCYRVYDQGPCREGKWLVFGFDLEPVCKKNICWDQELKQPSFGQRYWFNVNQTCYRTYTQGYCSDPQELLFNMDQHYRPTCQKHANCGEVNPVQEARCFPGQRPDVLGHCKRKFMPLRNSSKPLQIPITDKPANIYCLYCDEQTFG